MDGCRGALDGMGRSWTPVINLGIPVLNLLALCNPEAELVEESDFSEFWNSIKLNIGLVGFGVL